jgi:hypothetical protein
MALTGAARQPVNEAYTFLRDRPLGGGQYGQVGSPLILPRHESRGKSPIPDRDRKKWAFFLFSPFFFSHNLSKANN